MLRRPLGRRCLTPEVVQNVSAKAEATPDSASYTRQTRGKSVVPARRSAIRASYARAFAETDTRSFSNTREGRGREEKPKAIVKRFNENGEEAFYSQEIHGRR